MIRTPHPIQLAKANLMVSELPVAFDPEVMLQPLGSGLNSKAYRVGELGDYVIKITRTSGDDDKMGELLSAMTHEDELMRDRVGYNMPPTDYVMVPTRKDPGKKRIVTIQPFLEGIPLKEHLDSPTAELDTLRWFLGAALWMYDDTGQIPDLANVQQRFNVAKNSNVIVTSTNEGQPQPMLIDTTFGRIQRSEKLGPWWSRRIAMGVRALLQKID